MTVMTKYPEGTFSWADLSTTDPYAAKQFYGQIFGWTLEDMPAGDAATYTMAQLDGRYVAALSQMREDQRAQSIPPYWQSYVTVYDLDERAERVESLGGRLLAPPFDVLTSGRMAVAQDPTGATFALWEPRDHQGAGLVNEPGSLSWNELLTNDTEAARRFYTELFGWTAEDSDMGSMIYTQFNNDDRAAGGMMKIAPEWGEVPPNWMVYFAVDDCDATVDNIQGLGGRVMAPPTDIPQVGRFAAVADPQGANFSIIALSSDISQPPSS
jgi:predicted enzyme related to lactoylglutathione lyase